MIRFLDQQFWNTLVCFIEIFVFFMQVWQQKREKEVKLRKIIAICNVFKIEVCEVFTTHLQLHLLLILLYSEICDINVPQIVCFVI